MFFSTPRRPKALRKTIDLTLFERRGLIMRRLIEKLAKAERNFIDTRFLAPRIRGGSVVVKFEGLVKTYQPLPQDFEGWGVFRAKADNTAKLEHQAGGVQVAKYLQGLSRCRLYLVRPIRGQTWLAYPVNAETFRTRYGEPRPVMVHLVTLGRAFEQTFCRWDGANFWFDRVDRRGDPKIPRSMAQALKNYVSPEALKFSGLTPELREAYRLVFKQDERMRVHCSEGRLKQALELGGGRLESFVDHGDYWNTQWLTSQGERHTSAIRKTDLTVISAGICLDGEDAKFDLQSIVGVVEQRD
jgi:hypothetical protein